MPVEVAKFDVIMSLKVDPYRYNSLFLFILQLLSPLVISV